MRRGRIQSVDGDAWKGRDEGRCLAQECREEEDGEEVSAIVLVELVKL